ncbi:uncharacterized protein MELLADRAFT_63447 [Melampsora larici-populina 98AG31]|uniref:Secreted protein n=1 Tax=Melampsora larici-populina (strain 98AG31 / pathotype 3-4-7) TaxID=747676 RepID=F4RMN8_MELLP|nr:uncharacterized protein MELLADRAFT_63447 [Melampsora larici-populina 98AG31]EGG06349.1 hypothetical protein MELLADRAFT_63447 [Melampsora larici-populina 98AG31]
MDCVPYQRCFMQLAYILLIWNADTLGQPLKGKEQIFPQGLHEMEDFTEQVDLRSQFGTGFEFGDSFCDSERRLNGKPTLRFLFQQEDRENTQKEKLRKENEAMQKLYNKLMNPSDHFSPATYDLPSPRKKATRKLKWSQIEKLKPNELIDYISNFNKQVKLSKYEWEKAEDAERFSEESLYQPAVTRFLKTIRKGDRPIALTNKLKQIRESTKSISPPTIDDTILDRLVLRRFIKDQGLSLDEVDKAHQYSKSLQQDAFEYANKHITSGKQSSI